MIKGDTWAVKEALDKKQLEKNMKYNWEFYIVTRRK